MNSAFWRLVNIFHFWLLASARKKLAFARKMTALPDSEGLQPPHSPLSRTPTAYVNAGNGHVNGNGTAITGNSFITRTMYVCIQQSG